MGGHKRRPKKRKGSIIAINFRAFCVAVGVEKHNIRHNLEAYTHLMVKYRSAHSKPVESYPVKSAVILKTKPL